MKNTLKISLLAAVSTLFFSSNLASFNEDFSPQSKATARKLIQASENAIKAKKAAKLGKTTVVKTANFTIAYALKSGVRTFTIAPKGKVFTALLNKNKTALPLSVKYINKLTSTTLADLGAAITKVSKTTATVTKANLSKNAQVNELLKGILSNVATVTKDSKAVGYNRMMAKAVSGKLQLTLGSK